MTQLDRLEALAGWNWKIEDIDEIRAILPELIRVAQAAKRYRIGNPGGIWQESKEQREFCAVIDDSPLYREMENNAEA